MYIIFGNRFTKIYLKYNKKSITSIVANILHNYTVVATVYRGLG